MNRLDLAKALDEINKATETAVRAEIAAELSELRGAEVHTKAYLKTKSLVLRRRESITARILDECTPLKGGES